MGPEQIAAGLTPLLERETGGRVTLANVRSMTGGATREAWSLDATVERHGGQATRAGARAAALSPRGPARVHRPRRVPAAGGDPGRGRAGAEADVRRRGRARPPLLPDGASRRRDHRPPPGARRALRRGAPRPAGAARGRPGGDPPRAARLPEPAATRWSSCRARPRASPWSRASSIASRSFTGRSPSSRTRRSRSRCAGCGAVSRGVAT